MALAPCSNIFWQLGRWWEKECAGEVEEEGRTHSKHWGASLPQPDSGKKHP